METANLSLYSTFTLPVGILLPFVLGVIFPNEELTAAKIICCILIVISLFATVEKGKSKMALLNIT